jgi:AcrR family transcriptional regulator
VYTRNFCGRWLARDGGRRDNTQPRSYNARCPAGDFNDTRSHPRKPRARSQARIDSILDAARTLLAAEGVASLSIYSVAERAEIPPSSVYHFFASVPALLEALTADVHAAFRACLQAPIDHQALTGWRICRAWWSNACSRSTAKTPPPAN